MASTIKAAMAEMMKRNAERPNSGQRPPNLGQAEDMRRSCSTCQHFEENYCSLYAYQVKGDQTCNSWSPLPE